MLKVYIAGSIAEIEEIRRLKVSLRNSYINPICEWVDMNWLPEGTDPVNDVEACRTGCRMDLGDMDEADLIIFVSGKSKSAGKTTEIGYAIGTGKPIFFIGDPYTVFHHHPSIFHWKTIDEMLAWLVQNKEIVKALLS